MLTKINGDGTWSCNGITFHDISGEVYGALCRLRDYEKSGFEPDRLEYVKENIHIGSTVSGYTIFGIFGDYCIAKNPKSCQEYVVWKIDADGFGVNWGTYFDDFKDAKEYFFEVVSKPKGDIRDYWNR